MTLWPVTLPASPILDGFVENFPETVIRTNMDQGPAKTRQRSTAGIREFKMDFILTKNQTAVFDSFVMNDLNGGALPFDFTHPRTGEALSLRLKSAPVYKAPQAKYFRVHVEAEALPL